MTLHKQQGKAPGLCPLCQATVTVLGPCPDGSCGPDPIRHPLYFCDGCNWFYTAEPKYADETEPRPDWLEEA